ncbi:MAG: protein phosphatase 2C family protein [Parachlamydiales bacterium]|nr:protein phosphatase 2C family protein [Parachlamydiales bacterium]
MATIQSCSEFTRNIYNFQCGFHKKYAEDATLNGVIMTHLVGRVITIGVTLLLHAEAVCRAVAACFKNIQKVFSMTNEELIQGGSDLEFSKAAYNGSWKSFKAIFDPSILKEDEWMHPENEVPLHQEEVPQEVADDVMIFVDDEEAFRMPGEDRPQLGAAPPQEEEVEEEPQLGDGELNVVFDAGEMQMPAFAPQHPVQPQMPPIRQEAPIAGLNFADQELDAVGQGLAFQVPAFGQAVFVQPQMPAVRREAALNALNFADAELDVVAQDDVFQIPAFAEAAFVQPHMPGVRQQAALNPLNFADAELNAVEQGAVFQVPVFAEVVPVQPHMPGMRQEAAITALNFADAELDVVEQGDAFQVPAFADAVPVQPEMPGVRHEAALHALNFADAELDAVEQGAAFQIPAIAEAVPVQPRMPEMRQEAAITVLNFADAELDAVEQGDAFQVPGFAEAVPVLPQMPQARQARAISPLLFGDFELNVVPQGDDFHVPAMAQPVPVQPAQMQQRPEQSIGALVFDGAEMSVVDPSLLVLSPIPQMAQGVAIPVHQPLVQPLHLSPILRGELDGELVVVSPISPTEVALEITAFPPVAGSQSPGVVVQEDYFGAQANSPVVEKLSKETEEVLHLYNRQKVLNMLRDETSLASSHSSPTQVLQLRSAKDVMLNGDWELSSGMVCGYRIGRCHFTNGEIGMEHLATSFSLSVNKKEIKVPLVGIFDPVTGSTAARFLRVNLAAALKNHLQSFNDAGLTPEGIWVAINLAFVQLNQLFLHKFPSFANQGSSATVVMELDERLWILNLGRSRAVLNDRSRAFQCTSLDEQGGFGFSGQKICRPRITCYRLDKIGSGSHVIIGNGDLFKTAGSATLVDWITKRKDESLAGAARDIVYSAYQAKKAPLACFVLSLDHNDWEII